MQYLNISLLAIYIYLRQIHSVQDDYKFLPIEFFDTLSNFAMGIIYVKINFKKKYFEHLWNFK